MGDRRRRQRVREARPEKFLCSFVLRKLEESQLLDQIPRKGGEPSDVQVLHDKLTPSLWQGGQTHRWVKVIRWRSRWYIFNKGEVGNSNLSQVWKPAKDRWALGKPRKDSSTLVGHGQGQCQGVYLYKGGVKVPLSPRYATFPLGNAQIAPLLRFQSRSSTMFSYVGQGPCFCLVLSDKWSHFQLNLSRRQNGQNFGGPNICFDNFVSPIGRDRKIGVVPDLDS